MQALSLFIIGILLSNAFVSALPVESRKPLQINLVVIVGILNAFVIVFAVPICFRKAADHVSGWRKLPGPGAMQLDTEALSGGAIAPDAPPSHLASVYVFVAHEYVRY